MVLLRRIDEVMPFGARFRTRSPQPRPYIEDAIAGVFDRSDKRATTPTVGHQGEVVTRGDHPQKAVPQT